MKCQCTHEQGDSDCPIHVVCRECGSDISLRAALAMQQDAGEKMMAEVERLRAENAELRQENADQSEALATKFPTKHTVLQRRNAEIEELRAENAKLTHDRDKWKAAAEMLDDKLGMWVSLLETAKAENAELRARRPDDVASGKRLFCDKCNAAWVADDKRCCCCREPFKPGAGT